MPCYANALVGAVGRGRAIGAAIALRARISIKIILNALAVCVAASETVPETGLCSEALEGRALGAFSVVVRTRKLALLPYFYVVIPAECWTRSAIRRASRAGFSVIALAVSAVASAGSTVSRAGIAIFPSAAVVVPANWRANAAISWTV